MHNAQSVVIAVLYRLPISRKELLRAQREDRLDVPKRLFRHTVRHLALNQHQLVVSVHLPLKQKGTEEDERRNQECQQS